MDMIPARFAIMSVLLILSSYPGEKPRIIIGLNVHTNGGLLWARCRGLSITMASQPSSGDLSRWEHAHRSVWANRFGRAVQNQRVPEQGGRGGVLSEADPGEGRQGLQEGREGPNCPRNDRQSSRPKLWRVQAIGRMMGAE